MSLNPLRLCLAILALGLLCGGCRSTRSARQEPPEMLAAQASLRTASKLYQEGQYEAAREALAPVMGKPYYQREANLLNTVITQQLEKPRVDRAKRFSEARVIEEIDERLILPGTYGEVRVINPLTGPFTTPTGAMENLINRKVDISLINADLRTLLLTLSEIDGLNLIADDALEEAADKTITINVKGVPLKDILSYISRNMGISFQLGDNVIWVTQAAAPTGGSGPELVTKIIRLNAGYVPGGGGGGGGGGGTSASAGGGSDTLLDALNDFLADDADSPAGSKFVLYRDRNYLVIRNTAANIRKAEALIQAFDAPPLQVVIEARFITISQEDLFQLGVQINQLDWSGSPKAAAEGSAILPAVGEGVSGPATINLSGVLNKFTYDAVLTAIAKTGSARTMEAPRVTVTNNRPAQIRKGDVRFFFETFDVTSTGGDNPTTELVPSGEATELALGVTLSVTPSIGNNLRTISLSVDAEITDFIEMVSLSPDVSLPRTNENSINTTVTVNSSETVVLGGMMSSEYTNTTSKVPLLGDLPLIGFLFRKKENTNRPNHLLIFVTATVLDPDGAFNVAPPVAPADANR